MRKTVIVLLCLSVFNTIVAASEASASENIIARIDFSGQEAGNAIPWLTKQGYKLELDADKLHPRFHDGSIVLSTTEEVAGLVVKKFDQGEYLYNVKAIRIEWGVNRYPEGADWENEINRVPIAVMLSFGTEELPSGLLFGIKAAPYFISPFIGLKEKEGKEYLGKLYKKGGRYYCVASGDQSGKTIITNFEIDQRFKRTFNQPSTPPITAFSFQMNTKDTDGSAEAFLRKVEFIGN